MSWSQWIREHAWSFENGARYHGYSVDRYTRILERAMWNGDTDLLFELASCQCCCDEHTGEGCLARAWGGCLGQDALTRADEESWAAHYARFHGLTREQFFG